MTAFIYMLVFAATVGLLLTIIWLLRLLASFLSLFSTSYSRASGTWDVATGGVVSFWRVLGDGKNRQARRTLLRSAAFTTIYFVVTMGAASLLIELNSRHCVLDMTKTDRDGTVTSVCPVSDQ